MNFPISDLNPMRNTYLILDLNPTVTEHAAIELFYFLLVEPIVVPRRETGQRCHPMSETINLIGIKFCHIYPYG
jgi:hypothetical protein